MGIVDEKRPVEGQESDGQLGAVEPEASPEQPPKGQEQERGATHEHELGERRSRRARLRPAVCADAQKGGCRAGHDAMLTRERLTVGIGEALHFPG